VAVSFDLSPVPADSAVVSAELSLYCYLDRNPSSSSDYGVYEISRSWNDSQATWTNATTSETWQSPGGDFASQPIATASHPTVFDSSWDNYDVTAAARNFLSGAAPNYGVMIVIKPGSAEGLAWHSSQYAVDSLRPKLVITYASSLGTRRIDPPTAQGLCREGTAIIYRKAGLAHANMAVYAADGRRVSAPVFTANGWIKADLGALPKGVYLVNVNVPGAKQDGSSALPPMKMSVVN
jgi:hypothetical protein